MTLNDGTTTPNYNGGDPVDGAGTYHNWSSADRFNFAPLNLLLTPSKRKSIFASVRYDINDAVSLHAKALYNNRESRNQAAPEPIFVGPFAGTGGIADTIMISALNPYNPFGIDLVPGVNLGWITKRPVELGPRIFTQDVDTWYANLGLDGSFGESTTWNVDYVHSENKASQTFTNGFNLGHLKLALGDPALCAAVAGCVPLDLFGGEGRPITPEMFNYIAADQHDSSKQVLDLFNANITGNLFAIGDRQAGYALGVEHRRYEGDFNPDPLRQTGESQDSGAAAISASYNVSEIYGEMQVPWTSTFSTDFALRYSDYSTFGGATTGKVGLRWQPIQDLVLRGTYSEGFRAPNLGELYGLTQFGATLVDPCNTVNGAFAPQYASACTAAGVSAPFQQANTQIITFTGGNPDLKPEKSKNYSLGAVWSPSWAENLSWSRKLDFEFDYFHYKVTDAIQAPDIQALLNGCYDGSVTGAPCAGFERDPTAGFNLKPPVDFLDNLGTIQTSGIDFKANWTGPEMSWGQLSASLQSTHNIKYEAVDKEGNKAQREVGVEVSDSAIPDWQTNVQLGWKKDDWNLAWNIRYISAVDESCGNAVATPATGCATGDGKHQLDATTYHDVQLGWNRAFGAEGLKLAVGVNNLFDKDPPPCVSCSLNGYDAGTYDLPFRFWYVDVQYKF
jgi:iron complex outermembrane receptor protein